jgi:hypothetical protein
MPLKMELLTHDSGVIPFMMVSPGAPPGSFSHNPKSGPRDIFMVACARDDSHSMIWRSPGGVDIAKGGVREIIGFEDLAAWPVVKRIEPGEAYDLTLRPDNRQTEITIRFTHVRPGAP